MKTLPILALAVALAGCTTSPTTTTTTTSTKKSETIQGPKRVYTQEDRQRSGRATPGAALRTLDPNITASGE